eukprot:COSAG01_NODE_46225_length_402_cov_0.514851_1_plen_131_part_10
MVPTAASSRRPTSPQPPLSATALLLLCCCHPTPVAVRTIKLPNAPDCRQHPRNWTPPVHWRNASFCPRMHPISCGVYDPSGTISVNGTFFIFPDGAPPNTHWASTDLLHWSLRNQSWFSGLTGGISATPSG